ncbi:MAG: hypothetical protein ACFB2Y_11160, partial [Fulvivirga sp.]
MSESRINELFSRLAELMDQQNSISQELIQLRGEIKALKDSPQEQEAEPQNPEPEVRPVAAFKAMA